jgi:4-hydroxythreonine-4-phosphate dehydrogenase
MGHSYISKSGEIKMEEKLPLLITMGDPNGVGPEICLKLVSKKMNVNRPVAIVGDIRILQKAASLLKIRKPIISVSQPEEVAKASRRGIVVLESGVVFSEKERPGKISKKAGEASIGWVKAAVEWCLAKRASAVVTAPLCKEAVEKTVPGFQGHTEYIGEMCGDPEPVLCLVHGDWVIAHISTHVSLLEACARVKQERIVKAGMLLHSFLCRYKQMKNPLIGVSGLNPHAGEGGLFGREEITEIVPAIKTLTKKKIKAKGPFPADVLFPQLRSGLFDGALAMYHDQGHVVTKTLLFNLGKKRKTEGVNTTLGLPVLRTSVDHGTGFDIAWKGIADEQSLRDALELADLLQREEP